MFNFAISILSLFFLIIVCSMDTKIICWNCQGARYPPFHNFVNECRKDFYPYLFCLFDTQVSIKVDSIVKRIRFPNSFQVEANGFAGGIWLCWDENFLVDILEVYPQLIHVNVCNKQRSYSFFCSFVYVIPQSATRKKLCHFLGSLANCLKGPYILTGDFNSILDSSKRVGGASILKAGCKWFHEFLFNNALRDLGASGAQFTWCRGNLSLRLDRVVCIQNENH